MKMWSNKIDCNEIKIATQQHFDKHIYMHLCKFYPTYPCLTNIFVFIGHNGGV